jgi:hypothetical protein
MNSAVAANTKIARIARTFKPLNAAKNKELPSRIEIMRAGQWPDDSNKGFMKITTADLLEFKKNFDEGTGMAGGPGFGLPIDFMHEEWNKAAGWMKDLVVEDDVLYADVEWTKAGEEALAGGEFKCVSPSFYPSCLGSWHDPEDWSVTAQNVLVGAGLTNIPFFKDLTPIMASKSSQKEDGNEEKNVIYISEKETTPMQLADVRIKAAEELNEEEKTFLAEHKAELTNDEQTKFGFEVTADDKNKKEETPVQASAVKGDEGKVVMAATEVKAMNDRIVKLEEANAEFKKEKITASVQKHVERGAIKADQVDKWTQSILHDEGNQELLEALPSQQVLASEIGSDAKAKDASEQEDALHKATVAKVEAAAKEGQIMKYSEARRQVVNETKENQ